MITAGTYPPIHIDLGSNEPGMTLQREYREDGKLVWRDVVKDGRAGKKDTQQLWISAIPRLFPLFTLMKSVSALLGRTYAGGKINRIDRWGGCCGAS